MELVKPDPLIIDGRPRYTLTSYDPVSVEVRVSTVTEHDVDNAMQLAIIQEGGGPERLNDDAWIREKFDGVHGAAQLREMVRRELEALNVRMTEQQKVMACVNALAERLVQRVPDEAVAQSRQIVEQAFHMTLEEQGMDVDAFMRQSGMTSSDVDAMLDERAQMYAEQDAVVSAWADARGVEVGDAEVSQLLGIPNDPSAPNFERARAAARQMKATEMIVAECECTYQHVAPEPPSGHPHLKLV